MTLNQQKFSELCDSVIKILNEKNDNEPPIISRYFSINSLEIEYIPKKDILKKEFIHLCEKIILNSQTYTIEKENDDD